MHAYDPSTGEQLWKCEYVGYSVVPRPIYAGGLVILSTGYDVPELLAIRPGGKGDITGSHVVWHEKRGAPLNPSPLAVDDSLYLINDAGVATCRDVATGRVIWQQRIGGKYSASPVYAGGLIYLQSETGTTHIIEASRTFKKVGTNKVRGRTFASPAIVDDVLFLRTDRAIYRIESGRE